jgi:hypothetical protein
MVLVSMQGVVVYKILERGLAGENMMKVGNGLA